jgi:N-acetylglutamate synthase-like GNAT family acetyltransferase
MTPWSVRAIAGISSSAALATIVGMRLAPSSSEYSVWLWRWTKVFGACGIVLIVGVADPADSLLAYVPVTIRDATLDDQATIRRIVRAAGINPSALDWPRFIVAEDGGAIVGVSQVKPHGDGSRELASIAVIPERQGEGIGSTMIRAHLARETGTLYLTCRSQMAGYYERFGFARLERKQYPRYFARLLPVFNTLARPFGIQIIVMRRDAAN